MAEFLKNINFIKENTITGVELRIINNQEFAINYVVVKRSNESFELIQSECGVHSINDLCEKINTKIPVVLSIDGKGILHKRVKVESGSEYVNQLLPNASKDQFYMQEYAVNDSEVIVSIARRDNIKFIIDEFIKHNIKVTDYFFGPFSIESFSDSNGVYTLEHSTINVDNGKVLSVEKANSTGQNIFYYGTKTVNTNEIIPFSNAIYFFNKKSSITNIDDDYLIVKEEYSYSRSLKFLLWASLLFILVLLIVNFLIFDFYSKKQVILEGDLAFNSELTVKLNRIKEEYKIKQNLIEKSGFLFKTRISLYIDSLILVKPKGIRLRQLEYQPVSQKLKVNEAIAFQKKILKIKGVTSSSLLVNKWVDGIESFSWVNKVEIDKYWQDDINKPGEFEITIEQK